MKNKIKKLMNRALRKEEGFTLVEIIVVIVIMAILAAIAIPSVLGYINDAQDAKYIAEARTIYLACQVEEAKANSTNSNLTSTSLIHADSGGSADEKAIASDVETRIETESDLKVGTIDYTTVDGDEAYIIEFAASDSTAVKATVVVNGDIEVETGVTFTVTP